MHTLIPERADAERIYRDSGSTAPFMHAQRFAEGWNSCIELLRQTYCPAVAELIKAARDAECSCTLHERYSGHKIGCWMPNLSDALARVGGGK